jgi:hypothetical protein
MLATIPVGSVAHRLSDRGDLLLLACCESGCRHIASARFHSRAAHYPLSDVVVEYRFRNRAFVRWFDAATSLPSGCRQKRGKIMELLELEPPQYGVRISGIYVIDDDGTATLAGPFGSEPAAIRWIEQLRGTLRFDSQARADRNPHLPGRGCSR